MDSFQVGNEVAGYRLEAVVGRGGMGVVYRATHIQLQKTVAIKVLAPQLAEDADFRRRFQREWRIAAALDHPNIVDVYDAGQVAGALYLAMRFVQGQDLATLLKREGPLTVERTIALMMQVASALDAAHAERLVHRDVKPGNILIAPGRHGTASEQVYLVDFGIARSVESTTVTFNPFAGTAAYMAPEQFDGDPTPASDRYALACVLYECLSGKPPFPRDSLAQVMRAHLNDAPPSLARQVPALSLGADGVLATAMAKQAAQRYATCTAFVEAFNAQIRQVMPAVFAGEAPYVEVPTAATRPAPVRRSPSARSPRRWLPIAAVLALVVVAAGVAGVIRSARDPGPAPGEQAAPDVTVPQPAVTARLDKPQFLAFDRDGNLYVTDFDAHRVYRIDRSQTITTIVGNGTEGSEGDGGPAAEAQLDGPAGIAVAADGSIYIADADSHRVRKVDPSGIITTIAGNGTAGFAGDGGPATIRAQLNTPDGLALDPAGNLYIADRRNNRIRKVDEAGNITTVAGTGLGPGFSGDGGRATEAQLDTPTGVAIGADGSIYISDTGNSRVRKLDLAGNIATVAGTGVPGFSGDNSLAVQSQLNGPLGVAVARDGSIYVADIDENRVLEIDAGGAITTVAGNGSESFYGDNGPATDAHIDAPVGIALDGNGSVYFADSDNRRVRRVDPSGTIVTIAGNGAGGPGFSGDDGPASQAQLNAPTEIALDSSGNLYIADYYNNRVRRVGPDGTITTLAGTGATSFSGDGGPATQTGLDPGDVAVGPDRNIYVADQSNHRIRKIDPAGTITTVAGSGSPGYSGDGGPATRALLDEPTDVAIGADGSVYIADRDNYRIRKIDPAGTITTVAGNGSPGYSGDGGPATQAELSGAGGIAVGGDGSIYFSDLDNHRVRKVDPAGVITTVAGNGVPGLSGDGGPATRAQLQVPVGVGLDADGMLYIADLANNSIRKVDAAGIITTVAGNGTSGFSGDDGPATQAQLDSPEAVASDSDGTLYVADTDNHRIRKVDASGTITTVAGGGG